MEWHRKCSNPFIQIANYDWLKMHHTAYVWYCSGIITMAWNVICVRVSGMEGSKLKVPPATCLHQNALQGTPCASRTSFAIRKPNCQPSASAWLFRLPHTTIAPTQIVGFIGRLVTVSWTKTITRHEAIQFSTQLYECMWARKKKKKIFSFIPAKWTLWNKLKTKVVFTKRFFSKYDNNNNIQPDIKRNSVMRGRVGDPRRPRIEMWESWQLMCGWISKHSVLLLRLKIENGVGMRENFLFLRKLWNGKEK